MEDKSTYYVDLIIRYFEGELSSDEMLLLSDWLKSNPENQKLFKEYKQTFCAVDNAKIDNINIDDEWNKLSLKIKTANVPEKEETEIFVLKKQERPIRNLYLSILKVAAVIMVLAVSSFLLYHNLKKPESIQLLAQSKTIESKLPDGTSVTLNKGASITYPEKFEKSKRTVTLKGEAFFNVTPDKSKPFIVAAGDIFVEVLGTSFYVNTNSENANVEVILISGKVATYSKYKPSDRILLEPGEKAEFSKTEQKISKSSDYDENYIAWKTKKLVFFDNPLNEIILTLNKVYHSNIKLENENIADCRITATFDNQPLDAVLNVLQATIDLKIKKTGSLIEISGNGCK
ncbi:MAG: DUF4974 domain-containing protein [Bacteroidetes bacterium]|nr:DUF4974 domain-containing protein [Bacteroidota bacterium]